ncbi:hypothetical protein BASA81_018310 [Batrachochytrium salamandrivorans]|nr:hypothetical protein BASA81_018310 [Batrachochytrium salamandrivorans]
MKKVTFEEMLESMSARLHLIEAENESLKMDAQESRAIANRAMLENTVSSNSLPYTKEPRVCLPDKFDGTRKTSAGSSTSSSWFSNYNPIDLDWNDSALRAQFYFGLSYEIRTPWSTSTLLQLFPWQSSKQSKSTIDFMSVDSNGLRTSNTPWNQPQRRPPPPSPMVVPPPRSATTWISTLLAADL